MLRFVLVSLLSGCQCLVPVSDVPDGGTATDAGQLGPECVSASDCPAVSAPRACAFGGPTPTRSCFDGRCVFDCEGLRTCTTKTGSCLSCDGGVPDCTGAHCGWLNAGTTGRIFSNCGGGLVETPGPFVARYRVASTCNYELFLADGGRFGGLDLVGSETTDTATVDAEPGVTCTVRGLATALNRMELGCARCLYLVEWP